MFNNILGLLVLVLAFSSDLSADEFTQATLIGDKEFVSGGFGGLTVQTSTMNSTPVLFTGGKGAWLIDHTFYLGGEGHGLMPTFTATNPSNSSVERLYLGYGGVLFGMQFFPSALVHLNVEAMLGSGAAVFGAMSTSSSTAYPFFVSSLGSDLVMNITEIFHLELGLSYRYASSMGISTLASSVLNGPSLNVALLFGRF